MWLLSKIVALCNEQKKIPSSNTACINIKFAGYYTLKNYKYQTILTLI